MCDLCKRSLGLSSLGNPTLCVKLFPVAGLAVCDTCMHNITRWIIEYRPDIARMCGRRVAEDSEAQGKRKNNQLTQDT